MAGRGERLVVAGGDDARRAPASRAWRRRGASILAVVSCVALPLGGGRSVTAEEPSDPFLLVRKVQLPEPIELGSYELVPGLSSLGSWRVGSAIDEGCAHLVTQQGADGSFLGKGDPMFRVGITALAVLALMDAGHPYGGGSPESVVIRKGIAFLRKSQDSVGRIGPATAERNSYNHGFATYALVRAFELSRDEGIQRDAQRGLDFTAASRNPWLAWRYGITPGDNDTDVTGVMMLAYAEANRLTRAADSPSGERPFILDHSYFDGIANWIDKVTNWDTGRVGYMDRQKGPNRYPQIQGPGEGRYPVEYSESMTAVGTWLELQLNMRPEYVDRMHKQIALVAKTAPGENPHWRTVDQYYWYWGARLARALDECDKKTVVLLDAWRTAVVKALLARQDPARAPEAGGGSWPPEGAWGSVGGHIYSTALAISTLKWAAYRHKDDRRITHLRGAEGLADSEMDLDARLTEIEIAAHDGTKDNVKALTSLLADPLPVVRLAAAEALAMAGWRDSTAQIAVARRFAKEQEPAIREALVFSIWTSEVRSKSVEKAREAAAKDPDPGVRATAQLAQTFKWLKQPSGFVESFPDRIAIQARFEQLGKLGTDTVYGRTAAVRWRLLDECGLPCLVGTRVGERLPIVPLRQLEQDGALEAVEKALGAPAAAAAGEVLALYDAAVAAVEKGKAAPADRARLAAALAIHFARTRWSAGAATSGDVIERLDRHLEALKKVTSGLGPHALVAVRVLQEAVWRAIEAVRPAGEELSRVEVLKAAIEEHEGMARQLDGYPDQVQWMELGRAELLVRLAERTGKEAERKRAWELAYELVGAASNSLDGRRVALRAAALATRLAPDVHMSLGREDLLRRAPPHVLFGGTTKKDGIRVELADVTSQEVPLSAPGKLGLTSGREVLLVHVRITIPDKVRWDEEVWTSFVRARRGVPEKPVDVPLYEPAVENARITLEHVGHEGIPGGWTPGYWGRKSTMVVVVFDTTRSQLSDDLVIDVGVMRQGAAEPEIVASQAVTNDALLQSITGADLAVIVKRRLGERIPLIGGTSEGIDLLLLWAQGEREAGFAELARESAEQAETAAQELGDAARAERAKALLASLQAK